MKEMLDYLSALAINNEREWYHAHKEQYKQAMTKFEDLVETLILEVGELEPAVLDYRPKNLIFRVARDVRFSKDKSPFNPSFRAHFAKNGKFTIPVGYYISIQPHGYSIIAGGLFADDLKDATAMVRDYITANGDEWERIITKPSFSKYFTVQGTALKNVPRDYDKEHPQAQYLKNKSWYVECPLTDEELMDENFLSAVRVRCKAMEPFNLFLNKALADYVRPARS